MAERVFGEITGVPTGTAFGNRQELAAAGVHRPTQAGISGSASEGADSVVVSGGYVDDEDYGDVIIYTGHGGRDGASRRQVADQQLDRGNQALAKSCLQGLPVRVVRGANDRSPLSPSTGYRYDGLFFVESYWRERGRDGFLIWRFRLVREKPMEIVPEQPDGPVERRLGTVARVVRNTAMAVTVKDLHDHMCQVCGLRLETEGGPYAEGAHIRPLGRPHDGPDVEQNILCLCPNHHVLLDLGGICVDDELRVVDRLTSQVLGRLRIVAGHSPAREYFTYHRGLFS